MDLLHLLHNSVWGKVMLFSRNVMQMNVTMCLNILREDKTFFDNLDSSILKYQLTQCVSHSEDGTWRSNGLSYSTVDIARVFRAAEENDIKTIQNSFEKKDHQVHLHTWRETSRGEGSVEGKNIL